MGMKSAVVFLALVAFASAACDSPTGDCGEGGDCHPKCQWKCDSPVCNQVCEPICEQPKCSTRCQELGCSKCAIKCEKPQCEVRCPVKHCEKGACPKCDTVCKDPQCQSVCEEPLCDWKCHRPADCQKPKCALVCEKAPHCQPQPPPTDCCACSKPEEKCCGCEKEAVPTTGVSATDALHLNCMAKCAGQKDGEKCKALCDDLKSLSSK